MKICVPHHWMIESNSKSCMADVTEGIMPARYKFLIESLS